MKKVSVITVFILVAMMVMALFSGCANGVKTNKQSAVPAATAAPASSNEGNSNEGSGNEIGEASGHAEGGEGESGDPSSPILQLDESWDGVVNGIRVAMSYDAVKQSFSGIVENASNTTIKSILIELNLKKGTKTVVELGPHPVGDLNPGEQTSVEMLVADEPLAKGLMFDAWEIHPEAEGTGGEGSGNESGEVSGHAEVPEGTGSEGSESGLEEGSEGTMLGVNETYDVTKNGARLILSYDKSTQSFVGTVENTTNAKLTRARVEIHLSNGKELGPTTPTDLAVGEKIDITLDAKGEVFDGWVTHCEVGAAEGDEGSEGGSEHGGEGSEGYKGSGGGEGSESHGSEGSEG